jgi:hypothetical protein
MRKIKKTGMSLLLILIAMLVSNKMFAQKEKAIIQFDTKKHNFGTIVHEKDSVVEATFLFENKGNEPLVVFKVTASCNCTVSEWTKKPVETGKKGFVKVTFHSRGMTGKFSKSIYVKSNAEEDVVILKIEGEVINKKSNEILNLFKRSKNQEE